MGKIQFSPPKLSPFFWMAPQTTKTFEKRSFWQNMPIIPMSRFIFQLKEIQKIQKKIQKG
jgi:hypothetical protein